MTTKRPYPNVVRSKWKADGWEARLPGSRDARHLGTYDTPEAARCAVLTAQAERLEAKAAKYRAEVEQPR